MAKRRWRAVRLPSVVALVVGAAVAFGSVFYQLTGSGGHAHGGAPELSVLGVTADAVGVMLAVVLVVQLMLGYRLIRVPAARFRARHVAGAWVLIALLLGHGATGVVHSLQPPRELLPLALDVAGIALAALLVPQLVTGYRRSAVAARAGALHAVVALSITALAVGHIAVAVYHTVTG